MKRTNRKGYLAYLSARQRKLIKEFSEMYQTTMAEELDKLINLGLAYEIKVLRGEARAQADEPYLDYRLMDKDHIEKTIEIAKTRWIKQWEINDND